MFINNKYTKIYFNIINKALSENRKKSKNYYYENHHIIPKCSPFNGSNSKENLVLLTAKEHYICHLLLTKMCIGEHLHKMKHAFANLYRKSKNQDRIFTSVQYDRMKKERSSIATIRLSNWKENPFKKSGEENINFGKKHSKTTREKMSKSTSGENNSAYGKRWFTNGKDNMLCKVGEEFEGFYLGMTLKEGHVNAFSGRKHTDDTKKKISAKNKETYKNGRVVHNKGKRYKNPSRSGKKWITNDIQNKLVDPSHPLPEGWRFGLTIRN